MFVVDCRKCPLSGCCKFGENLSFQEVNLCPLAHTVYTQVKDWNKFQKIINDKKE
jgi:hypothetical protein